METNVLILALTAFTRIIIYVLLAILLAFNAPWVGMQINALLAMKLLSYKTIAYAWLIAILASAITLTLTFAHLVLNFV